jgi:hypothetical protein
MQNPKPMNIEASVTKKNATGQQSMTEDIIKGQTKPSVKPRKLVANLKSKKIESVSTSSKSSNNSDSGTSQNQETRKEN